MHRLDILKTNLKYINKYKEKKKDKIIENINKNLKMYIYQHKIHLKTIILNR
jgi:hypothetical protein